MQYRHAYISMAIGMPISAQLFVFIAIGMAIDAAYSASEKKPAQGGLLAGEGD